MKRPPPNEKPSVTGLYVPWRLAPPRDGESVRWENIVDGRWVTVAMGRGSEAGKTVVTSCEGERHIVDSYDRALSVAKKLRT